MADLRVEDFLDKLMNGMSSFLSTKTVVGEPVRFGDTIILPLVDVSFGMGAGTGVTLESMGAAFCIPRQKALTASMEPTSTACIISALIELKLSSGETSKPISSKKLPQKIAPLTAPAVIDGARNKP